MPQAFLRYYHKISQRPMHDTFGPFPCDLSDISSETAFRKWVAQHGCGQIGRASRRAKFRVESQGAVFFFSKDDPYHSLAVTISQATDVIEYLAWTEPGMGTPWGVKFLAGCSTDKYRTKPADHP